jgi:hypothetical protein
LRLPSPPPPAIAATVNAVVQLAGYTSATFSSTARTAFVGATASVLGVSAPQVTILSVTDVSLRRRRLAAAGVQVSFSVAYASTSAAASGSSALTTALNSGAMSNALVSSGVAVKQPLVVVDSPQTTYADRSANTASATQSLAVVAGAAGGGGGGGLVLIVAVVVCMCVRKRRHARAVQEGAAVVGGGKQAQSPEFVVVASTTTTVPAGDLSPAAEQ